jgi:D-3-phosphoglycerate dehydrogenase
VLVLCGILLTANSDVHVIGIRSKTKLTERVLREAKNLIVVGCFCIGTNQVDLNYAAKQGIAVFNSPFANSRSVAELVIGEIIMLARQLGDRSNELHNGIWNKVSAKCWEIRGKTLGWSIDPAEMRTLINSKKVLLDTDISGHSFQFLQSLWV